MSGHHMLTIVHLFLDGTERPLCGALTGKSTQDPHAVTCIVCARVIQDQSPLWRQTSPGEAFDWCSVGDRVAVTPNGTRVEVRARTGSVMQAIRKRLEAKAFPIGVDPKMVLPSNNGLRRAQLMVLQGRSARAALALCALNRGQP